MGLKGAQMRVNGPATAALLLIFSSGCEGEPTDREKIEGTWVVATPDEYDCVLGFYFDGNLTYEQDIICSLEGGGYGIEARMGEWFVENGKLRLYPTASSCGEYDSRLPVWLTYDMPSDDRLRFVDEAGVVMLERVPDGDGAGSAVAKFGCYDESRAFTPMPIVEL